MAKKLGESMRRTCILGPSSLYLISPANWITSEIIFTSTFLIKPCFIYGLQLHLYIVFHIIASFNISELPFLKDRI